MIRTSCVRRPGQTRGVRFYSVADLDRLIAQGVEERSVVSNQPAAPVSPKPAA